MPVLVHENLKATARRLRKSTPASVLLEDACIKTGLFIAGLIPENPNPPAAVRTLHVSVPLFEQLKYTQKQLNQQDWNFTLYDIVSANWNLLHDVHEKGEIIGWVRNRSVTAIQPGDQIAHYDFVQNILQWASYDRGI